MRYEKKVTWLLGALAALLVIWAAGLVFSPERMAARSESAQLIAGKPSDVAAVSLTGGSLPAPIQLIKSGAGWTMTDGSAQLPVQSSRVTAFVNALASVTRLRQVARSKDSWAGFQLDDAKAKRATLKDASGKVLADIYVGNYGPTGGEVYLRHLGSDNSYTVDASIASYFSYGRPSWLDLAVLGGIKETDVQSLSVKAAIELEGKGKPALALDYGLTRDGKLWKAGAAQVDADSVDSYLRAILGLQGEDYIASPPADAFARIDAKLTIELGSGASKVLQIGASAGNDRFYGRIGDQGLAFTISTYSLKAALKSLADLSVKK
jgi:hypothetical protein